MLTRAEYDQMMTDRFFWLLEQVGGAEHTALNDILRMGAASLPDLIRAAMRREADVHVVLAVFGWLPMQPSGGPPFLHVCNPEAFSETVHLVSEAHRAAYVLFEDMAREHAGSDWSPYPLVL